MISAKGYATAILLGFAVLAGLTGCGTKRTEVTPTPQPAVAPPPPQGMAKPPGIRVAMLVPTTGETAAVGEALVNGAQMALFDLGDDQINLLVKDTGASPDQAIQQVQAAIADKADIILGPLFSSAAKAAAPIARQNNVPMIAFSNDVTVAGQGVYVLGVTPETQIQRVVGYAIAQGKTRFAAAVPADAYGEVSLQALQDATARLGGTVVTSLTYQPGDWSIATFKPLQPAAVGGYDALLLPAGGQELMFVASLLAAADVDQPTVRFLGTRQMADIRLAKLEPALDGSWFADTPSGSWDAFSERYQSTYGSEPRKVAALGYDAMAIAAVLGKGQASAPTSPYTPSALTRPDGFAGVDGLFRFLPDGRSERALNVLRLTRNDLIILDPAPSSFTPSPQAGSEAFPTAQGPATNFPAPLPPVPAS